MVLRSQGQILWQTYYHLKESRFQKSIKGIRYVGKGITVGELIKRGGLM